MRKFLPAIPFVLALFGCSASQASGKDTLPAKNVTQCRSLCDSAGMPLESIVVVANQTGCVCGATPNGGAAATTGGAVAVVMAQQAQQQQQLQQQQRHY